MCKLFEKTEKKEYYNIKLTNGDNVLFSNNDGKYGNILLCGFFEGMFGEYDEVFKCFGFGEDVANNNMQLLIDTIKKGHQVWAVGCNRAIRYINDVICEFVKGGVFSFKTAKKAFKGFNCGDHETDVEYGKALVEQYNKVYDYCMKTNTKFDGIIINPPYCKSLHLDFFERSLDLLESDGYMTIIEPSTWLINIRKNGKAKRYNALKDRLKGHIKSVVIENLNKEFNTQNQVPFATTTIDMANTYDTIDCTICGEHKVVNSIYDCNLIGSYNTIWSILDKVQKYGDMMDKHITNKEMDGDYWYAKCADIGRCGCSSGDRAHLDSFYYPYEYGELFKYFYFNGFDNRDGISNKPLKVKDGGNRDTDKIANCVYGTKNEITNWSHFIMNNHLPLFISLVTSIDQNNNSKAFLPWLVDREYTDEEINKLFGFTDEEIGLINRTLKKYERNSPWFRRYMCGIEGATDEEVNNFVSNL